MYAYMYAAIYIYIYIYIYGDFGLWKEAVQSVEVCLCMHIYVGWYMHGDLVEDRSNAVCGSRA